MEAAGRWALAFPAIDRLKFVAMLCGSGWMLLPGSAPQFLREGDVCLLGRTAYAVASHPEETPLDGQEFYAAGCDIARLGGDDTIGIGGTVTLTAGSADFLLDRLPECMVVPRSSTACGAVATILGLRNSEIERDLVGSEIVSARLADVLLVEAIRAYAGGVAVAKSGGSVPFPTLVLAERFAPSTTMSRSSGLWRSSPVWPVCRAPTFPPSSPVAWANRRSLM